jgi:uncharacterized membrane protein YeaQ/YmgE (transglycosylase-associated protein family)
MLTFIIVLLIIGLIAGALARFLVPGRDPMGCLGTMVLGVAGSFLGGFLTQLVEYHNVNLHRLQASGLLGSILGAIILLIVLRLSGLERGHRRRRRS